MRNPPRRRPIHRRRRGLAAFAALALLSVVPQYVRAYRIHGPSDAPNYVWGDLILVNRAAYDVRLPFTNTTIARPGTPRRGEVVLLKRPDADYDVTRRIIGLPGDTVEVRDSRVLLNGRSLAYEPAGAPRSEATDSRNKIGSVVEREQGEGIDHQITYTPGECGVATTPPVTVPDGHFYVLGDNRDHCTDSRRLGPILASGFAVESSGPSGRGADQLGRSRRS